MAFPIYQKNSIKITKESELEALIPKDVNLRSPVVVEFTDLTLEEETNLIHLLQEHLEKIGINPRFPYPIYAITSFEPNNAIQFTCLRSKQELPKFFLQKDGRMNLKESHQLDKIKLLQQESSNSSNLENMKVLNQYSRAHRMIHRLDQERAAYQNLLTRLKKNAK